MMYFNYEDYEDYEVGGFVKTRKSGSKTAQNAKSYGKKDYAKINFDKTIKAKKKAKNNRKCW